MLVLLACVVPLVGCAGTSSSTVSQTPTAILQIISREESGNPNTAANLYITTYSPNANSITQQDLANQLGAEFGKNISGNVLEMVWVYNNKAAVASQGIQADPYLVAIYYYMPGGISKGNVYFYSQNASFTIINTLTPQ